MVEPGVVDGLVKRLLQIRGTQFTPIENALVTESADALLALKAEVDELRVTLAEMVYETTHLSPHEDDGSHWCRITGPTLERARAILSGESVK